MKDIIRNREFITPFLQTNTGGGGGGNEKGPDSHMDMVRQMLSQHMVRRSD